jgi:hypothetical protein
VLKEVVEFIEVLPTPFWTAVNSAVRTIEFSDKIGIARDTPTIKNQLSHVFCLAVTLNFTRRVILAGESQKTRATWWLPPILRGAFNIRILDAPLKSQYQPPRVCQLDMQKWFSMAAVADFGRSCLPGWTLRLAATCVNVNKGDYPISRSHLHTRFALLRKSFPAEKDLTLTIIRDYALTWRTSGQRPKEKPLIVLR